MGSPSTNSAIVFGALVHRSVNMLDDSRSPREECWRNQCVNERYRCFRAHVGDDDGEFVSVYSTFTNS